MRLLFFIVFFSLLLSGCFDSSSLPPVVNGWYQQGAASNFYVVRSDDTIYSIAFEFGLNYQDLVIANNLNPPYKLQTGQRLKMTHQPAMLTRNQPTHYSAFSSLGWHCPVRGQLLQKFSQKPGGHPGISIGGWLGEPIQAASNGVVVYSGDGVRGYGNLIIVKKNDQYLSAYAHNQRNLVKVGDYVHSGQVIAHMGKNDADRTLLYFEIRRGGVPVDPMKYISLSKDA
ncbi:MAG: hypothetical protein A3E82_01465 [Gammaproteobacteria bacterium RIFCSPHIGHO2_12_FULL_38_11]|nr:MAG: hypothetical protein A3E82_01465 [Gammaproteobacteria bacterium RIFCSPHIGHO2_12_FULL_38_11]